MSLRFILTAEGVLAGSFEFLMRCEINGATKTSRACSALPRFRRGAGACALFASRASSRGCARLDAGNHPRDATPPGNVLDHCDEGGPIFVAPASSPALLNF